MNQERNHKAARLNAESFVVDAHFDLPWDVANQRERGRKAVIAEQYLDRFREGGFNLIVASIFIENFFLPEMGLRRALDQISHLAEELETLSGAIDLCRRREDIRRLETSGAIGLMLSLEGADPLQNDLHLLRIFYDLGVRGLGLTWSRRNYAADGCAFTPGGEPRGGGLTSFGRALVARAEALGMLIDVSHMNEPGFWDVIGIAQTPVIASHSNCRALADTPRNLKDRQIEALAAKDGVMGMNAISAFVGAGADKRGVDALLDHVDHVVRVAGIRHVGIGFDFCGGFKNYLSLAHPLETYDVLPGHHRLKDFTAGLLKRNYAEDDIRLILGGNFRRVFEDVLN